VYGLKHAPAGVRAVFAALRFDAPDCDRLRALSELEWKRALAFCDRRQLTLILGERCASSLPDWVRERIEDDLRRNSLRVERARAAYDEIARALSNAGLEWLVLKGFSQWPRFTPDPRLRVQYDFDLFLPRDAALHARDALRALGYEPIAGSERLPVDHLPTLVRKTGWRWRGDFFDPDIPLSVELHFRFWDPSTERLRADGLNDFWRRRVPRCWDGLHFIALDPADALGYAALHSLRHLLRGDARPYHVYELAWFLHASAGDLEFWRQWQDAHHSSLRRLEAVAFRLAHEWFGCGLPAAALSPGVERWFEEHAFSPIDAEFRPNKDSLWLHLALLESSRDAWSVARRRLFPVNLPGPIEAVHVPANQMTRRLRVRKHFVYAMFVAGRALHHARALPSAVWSGLRWFLARSAASRISKR
jgi:hypothetical protein